MKTMIGVAAIGMMVLVAGGALAQEAGAVTKQTVCPVMGGAVNTNLFVDFEGKRIYVCCKGCLPEVRKDPAKYIAKLEKAGITPAKSEAK